MKNFASEATEDDTQELKPASDFKSSPACDDLIFIHRLIKKKFNKILSTDFKSIPSKPEFHFFFPSWTKESKPVSETYFLPLQFYVFFTLLDSFRLHFQSSVGMLSPGVQADTPVGVSVEQIMPLGRCHLSSIRFKLVSELHFLCLWFFQYKKNNHHKHKLPSSGCHMNWMDGF